MHIAADVDLGARVGPCTLTEMLGKGSFGRVYGVVNDESGTPEAIKAIDKTCLTEARHASALHREIRMHGRLRHDHIIGMFGASWVGSVCSVGACRGANSGGRLSGPDGLIKCASP